MNEDRLRKSPNVAIVGSSSPLGKELKDMLEEGPFPAGKLIPLETEEYAGLLQEFAGEISITQIISPETLAGVDIAFFACSAEIMKSFLASGAAFPDLTIDLTQSGRPGTLYLNGVTDPAAVKARGYFLGPHPATIVLTRLLTRLNLAFGLEFAVATVLEPASERGSSGVEELQSQTISLLNFQGFEKKIFHGQLAFNLLPSPATAEQTETAIISQISSLTGGALPSPAVSVIQAPVFHSHGYSVHVQLLTEPDPAEVLKALHSDPAFVLHSDAAEVSPVTIVGDEKIHVGRLRKAGSRAGGLSLWAAADNLRLAAGNAIRLAESIILSSMVS